MTIGGVLLVLTFKWLLVALAVAVIVWLWKR